MAALQETIPESAGNLPQASRPSSSQASHVSSVGITTKNEPLVGKAPTTVRAPRPAYLTLAQLEATEKDQPAEYRAMGLGTSESGHASPISPMDCSEPLQTSSVPDRQRLNKYPPSPEGTSHLPPRLHSPASQIFERSVQEDILPAQTSPSIPAHILTENYIPPVLEASSAAITDDQLDPDSVEIVTHNLHQSAAPGVTGSVAADQSMSSSMIDHAGAPPADMDAHGVLDADVRRLSFISFADVVNAEHAETGDLEHSQNLSQGASSRNPPFPSAQNRSPSPLRSPTSSHGLGTSPPTSIATSFKGLEMSPNHGPRRAGSPFPLAQSPVSSHFGGDLNVETMRQALRRTGSGDLGVSVISTGEDENLDRPF